MKVAVDTGCASTGQGLLWIRVAPATDESCTRREFPWTEGCPFDSRYPCGVHFDKREEYISGRWVRYLSLRLTGGVWRANIKCYTGRLHERLHWRVPRGCPNLFLPTHAHLNSATPLEYILMREKSTAQVAESDIPEIDRRFSESKYHVLQLM